MFCCKGKRLANFLLEHNCKLVRIDCDQKSKGFLVFLFDEGESLNSALNEWETARLSYLIQ